MKYLWSTLCQEINAQGNYCFFLSYFHISNVSLETLRQLVATRLYCIVLLRSAFTGASCRIQPHYFLWWSCCCTTTSYARHGWTRAKVSYSGDKQFRSGIEPRNMRLAIALPNHRSTCGCKRKVANV